MSGQGASARKRGIDITRRPARLTVARAEEASLRECAEHALRRYFAALGEAEPQEIYELVLVEVEHPLLRVVLEQTGGNQSKAAAVLGINRSTLRKKLRRHGLYD